jgi:hypothetical protein
VLAISISLRAAASESAKGIGEFHNSVSFTVPLSEKSNARILVVYNED